MNAHDRLLERRDALADTVGALARTSDALEAAVQVVASALSSGGRVLIAGNGGSAAEAQHLSGELIGRLTPLREREPLPGIALTADTGVLTALANDYGYDQVFARQVAGLGRAGDALVVLSTSGASENCVAAVDKAKQMGLTSVGLLGGTRRALHDRCDVVVAVPSVDIPTIQECHLVLIHLLVELVEDRLDRASG